MSQTQQPTGSEALSGRILQSDLTAERAEPYTLFGVGGGPCCGCDEVTGWKEVSELAMLPGDGKGGYGWLELGKIRCRAQWPCPSLSVVKNQKQLVNWSTAAVPFKSKQRGDQC